jgi:hypothetical protein
MIDDDEVKLQNKLRAIERLRQFNAGQPYTYKPKEINSLQSGQQVVCLPLAARRKK